MSENYYSLREKLQELIFHHWRKNRLMENHKLWRQLGTSLYVLSDTQNAIESFRKFNKSTDNGINYLMSFGILQVLFLQQDALKSIIESLGLEIDLTNRLKEIRNIRNDIAGHPTNRRNQKSSHFIVQSSLETKQFTVADQHSDELPQFRFINTSSLVDDQQKEVTKILKKIIRELEIEWEDHKEEFKMNKLSEILHFNAFYKDLEEISRPFSNEPGFGSDYGKSALETLMGRLENFKSELAKRDLLDNIDSIDHILAAMKHPLNGVHEYYRKSGNTRLEEKDVKVFLEFLRFSLQELYDIASQIDDEYKVESANT